MNNAATGAAPPHVQEPPFTRALPWVVLVSMMFLLNILDRAMFGPLLPALENEFNISHAASTRFLLYIALGYSASLFLSGYSASRVRPKMLVGASLILSGCALLAISAATLPLLPFLFTALGLAAGQYLNGSLSTLRSLAPPSQWPTAISIHEVGPCAGFFLAPLLVEVGLTMFDWRGLVAGMGWLTIAGGALFLLIAKGGDSPAAPLSLQGVARALKEPKLWLFAWLISLAIAGEVAPFSVLTLHMLNERHLSQELTAFLLSASRIAAPFAVLGGGYVTNRFGVKRTLAVCLAAYALGMFCMAMPWFWVFVAGLFVQPTLTAMLFPPIFTLLAQSFTYKEQPVCLAIGMTLAAFVGWGLMPFLLGLWGDLVSFGAGFIMLGCLVAMSFPLLRLAPGKS